MGDGHLRNLNWRYLPYIRPMFQENIPTKYGQKYSTVHPFQDPEIPVEKGDVATEFDRNGDGSTSMMNVC